jgi:hypothetical protein
MIQRLRLLLAVLLGNLYQPLHVSFEDDRG